MSFEKPTDWAAVTPEEWAAGFAAVARKYGVSRSAAHGAYQRLQNAAGTPGVHGRAPKPIPADFDATAKTSDLMARYDVSRPTVLRWKATATAAR